MKIATIVARVLLGLVFFVFGLNGFLNFMSPPAMPEKAGSFIMALVGTGYLMTVVKIVEVTCGFLLLAGLYVPFALVLLAPVLVNIVLFHLYLTPPDQWIGALIFAGLEIFLMWQYRAYYRPIFTARAVAA
jgi:uncharacterized membrane protein YphA (DoxX/SURF4 family)